MCGICGVFNFGNGRPAQEEWLRAMNREIVHRGPDDDGYFVSGPVGLAMRRLSIIDLDTGHQPLGNEDGALQIVFNGEIYNYQELRSHLIERGHQFRTHSDTETIIHLYEEYGSKCVQRLRGMFAFAIWNSVSRRLFLARDRLGIKPLYYRSSGKELIFASEIKSLLKFPGVHAELNAAMIPEYLAFGYLSGPETFYYGINCLPPGHTMEVDESGTITRNEYWDLGRQDQIAAGDSLPRTTMRSEMDWIVDYRRLLDDCVGSHLMSDVPLGMFLSGGLDSSAVAAIASKRRGEPIDTFSVGYQEAAFSELSYAREVSQHIGSRHHEVQMSRDDFFGALPRLIWHEDKPITWPSSVSLYFVARLARKHVKVVLTGEGSDETLGGYTRYAVTLWNQRFHEIYRTVAPAGLRQRLRQGLQAEGASGLRRKLAHTFLGRDGDFWESIYFENFLCAFSAREQQALLDENGWKDGCGYKNGLHFWEQSAQNGRAGASMLSRMLYADIKTYLVELLMKQDRMSMAASVESRVPFLDHKLVEFAAIIPASLKVRGLGGKWILKKAVHDLLPPAIIHRKKLGFPTPWRTWLSGPQFPWVESLLTGARSEQRKLFKPAAVTQLLHEHRSSKRDHTDRLWRLLNLELWCRVFLDGETPADIAPPVAQRAST